MIDSVEYYNFVGSVANFILVLAKIKEVSYGKVLDDVATLCRVRYNEAQDGIKEQNRSIEFYGLQEQTRR